MSAATAEKPRIFNLREPLPFVCSGCGVSALAGCKCGVEYVPAGKRAEEAVVANPEKSDRAIADDIGVSNQTVRRARAKSTVTNVTVEKRTGKDGKTRKLPKRPKVKTGAHTARGSKHRADDPIHAKCEGCDTAEQTWRHSLGNMAGDAASMCAFWTRQFGTDWEKFEVPSSLVTLAKQAAEEWRKLASDLAKRRKNHGND